MNLYISDTTMREINGDKSTFPECLREMIRKSLDIVDIEEMNQALSKKETDPDNLDGRIETSIRNASCGDIAICANHRISNQTKFNCDIVIHKGNVSVFLEIEKGYLARFELDILKMQVSADALLEKGRQNQVYGAFIVPANNVVASHISGNHNESSFKYLTRLSRLVGQIKSLKLGDILIVGYGATESEGEAKSKGHCSKSNRHRVNHLIKLENGSAGFDTIKQSLPGYPLNQVAIIRNKLNSEIARLQEYLNRKGRYLAYSNGTQSDALYVHIQKKRLVLDIRVSKEEAEELRRHGFDVNPKNNYQGKAGWLTGVSVPHNSDKLNVVIQLAMSALEQ